MASTANGCTEKLQRASESTGRIKRRARKASSQSTSCCHLLLLTCGALGADLWLVLPFATNGKPPGRRSIKNMKLIIPSEGSGKPSTPAVGSAPLYLFRLIHHTTSSPPHRLTETCVRSRGPFHIQTASELADRTGCVSDSTHGLVSHSAAITPGRRTCARLPVGTLRHPRGPGRGLLTSRAC